MIKKKPKLNKKNFIIATLRKGSYRWPARNAVLKKNKIGRNQYICKQCGDKKIWGRKDVQIDHIEPIIPVTSGWVSFDHFIERLFCDEINLQILCIKHHSEKTKKEKELRKHYKKLQKIQEEQQKLLQDEGE